MNFNTIIGIIASITTIAAAVAAAFIFLRNEGPQRERGSRRGLIAAGSVVALLVVAYAVLGIAEARNAISVSTPTPTVPTPTQTVLPTNTPIATLVAVGQQPINVYLTIPSQNSQTATQSPPDYNLFFLIIGMLTLAASVLIGSLQVAQQRKANAIAFQSLQKEIEDLRKTQKEEAQP